MQLLECVNTCLSAMGEARVTSPTVRHPTVDLINSTIVMKKRQLLEKGWYFNKSEVKMFPALDGTMEYPVDTLSVVGACGEILVPRGGKLFDMDNNTNQFTEPKTLFIAYDVEFEDLPECAANVIMYRSAREVYVGDLGADTSVQNMLANEVASYSTLELLHIRNMRYSTRQLPGWVKLRRALRN